MTAAQLAELDVAMSNSDDGRAWVDGLTVTGLGGTLKHRLLGTPGQGRFRGKTGTLDDVRPSSDTSPTPPTPTSPAIASTWR